MAGEPFPLISRVAQNMRDSELAVRVALKLIKLVSQENVALALVRVHDPDLGFVPLGKQYPGQQ